MKNNRILILDDLRGIAILTVAFYYYFFVYYKNNDVSNTFLKGYKVFNDYLNFGAFGVSLFFLTSGFVIAVYNEKLGGTTDDVTDRTALIIFEMKQNKTVTTKKLAKKSKVNKRTILRDIEN